MKYYFIIAAAAIVAMAACTKTEIDETVVPNRKVTFQAVNYATQTKAGPVSVFNDFKNFQCRAFLHAEGIDIDNNGAFIPTSAPTYQEFFTDSGETISPYDASDQIINAPTASTENVAYWAPSHEYYWPKGEKSFVNFVGWYGTDGTNTVNPVIEYTYNTDKWVAKMTWEYTASTGSAGSNFLFSQMAWRYNDNPAATYKKNGLASTYKGVPMLFKHALAQINVKAYATGTDLTAGTDKITEGTLCERVITLENVKITPVLLRGKLELTNEDPGNEHASQAKDWSGNWAANGNAAPTDLVAANKIVDQVEKANAEDVFEATCVVPQTLGSTVVLSFDVRIVTTYKTGGARHEELLHREIALADASNGFGTNEWEMNHKYTYYLNILPSQSEVRFDPALDEDWEETTPAPVKEI